PAPSMSIGVSDTRSSLGFDTSKTSRSANARSAVVARLACAFRLSEGSLALLRISQPNMAQMASCPVKEGIAAIAGALLMPTALRLAPTGRFVGRRAGAWLRSVSTAGGSAMPCGLVLLAAKAKLAAAFWLPDVRLAAPMYW